VDSAEEKLPTGSFSRAALVHDAEQMPQYLLQTQGQKQPLLMTRSAA
jgi:hypothetical protein